MAKVVIVKPPIVVPIDSISSQSGIPPIGVAYLAGALQAAGHTVQVIDAHGEALGRHSRIGPRNASAGTEAIRVIINGLPAEEIADRVDEDVDLIAISCMFSNEWIYTKTVIRALAAAFPDVPIIAGGEHINAEPERVMRTVPAVRVCGLGEGEETIVELTDYFCGGLGAAPTLDDIPGIAYIDVAGNFVKTRPRARMRDLDDVAPPAWDVVPVRAYHEAGLALGEYNRRAMPVLATRGCPYQCTFCTNPQMWEPRWYARSPRAVVDEIKAYIDRYAVDHIDFCDLTAIVNKAWTLEFCKILQQEKLGVSLALPVGTRSEALTEEVLTALRDAGIIRIQYAPESGSPETLRRIKKAADLDKMTASMRNAVRVGLVTKATLIYGFPGQTLGEVWESVRFSLRLAWIGVNDVACFHFVPYPGSELYAQLNENGVLPTASMNEEEYDDFLAGNLYNRAGGMKSYSEHIPSWMLPMLTIGGMALFYATQFTLRPHRFVRVMYNLIRGKPLSMFETTVHGLISNFVKGRRLRVTELESRPAEASPDLLAPATPSPPP